MKFINFLDNSSLHIYFYFYFHWPSKVRLEHKKIAMLWRDMIIGIPGSPNTVDILLVPRRSIASHSIDVFLANNTKRLIHHMLYMGISIIKFNS